jgi:hypothetical protein
MFNALRLILLFWALGKNSQHIAGLKSDGFNMETLLWTFMSGISHIFGRRGGSQADVHSFTVGAIRAIKSVRTTTH